MQKYILYGSGGLGRLSCAVFTAALALCAALLLQGMAQAADELTQEAMKDAIAASVKAEGRPLDDLELIDQDGVRFRLSDYFKNGRPLLVSFVYTTCPEVCPTITAEFRKVVDEARGKYGVMFGALTVTFDPDNDTVARMKAYGARFTRDFSAMRFATGRPADIKKLLSEVGFFYRKRADGSFDHLDMATIVRSDGTIYKQVYSMRTQGVFAVERIGELLTGRPAVYRPTTITEKLRFFCYKYDPKTNTYVIDYAVVAGMALEATVMAAIVALVWGGKIKARLRGRAR